MMYLVGTGIIIVIAGTIYYNKFITLKNIILESEKQIDVQLQRRGELIPSLVETVKGYAKHEEETFSKITKARNVLANSGNNLNERLEADSSARSVLGRLFAVAESYPDLKANGNFMNLQEELQNTQNKIAFAQQHYNNTVKTYNTLLEKIPSNLFASIFKFKAFEFIVVPEELKKAPKIEF